MLQSHAMSLTYFEAVQWYYDFARLNPNAPRLADEQKLAQMRDLLARLDEPHQKFPSILIAGTKGKGSTAALVERILRAAGYRTGLFTSPHLHSFRERVRVGGKRISRARVVESTRHFQTISSAFPSSTFFEWVTAMAFHHFARARVDIAVVEVGLGGRLDCTNVLTPRVAVITPISFDHVEILGNTLEKIAYEKAGIIKPNVPVVVAPQAPEAMRVIAQVARERNAPLVDVSAEWCWQRLRSTRAEQIVQIWKADRARGRTYRLPLHGPHQRANLAAALASIDALRAQGWRVPARAARRGVQTVEWHARFEILARKPFVVADGAHNRASAHELVRTLDEVFPGAQVHFIFGASSDKDIRGMLAEIAPRAASLTFTQSHHARAASPEALAALVEQQGVETRTAAMVADALHLARRSASPAEVICVTGSLFVAAETRECLAQERGISIDRD